MERSDAELFERAFEIALEVHIDQRDKVGGAYILHPVRVMGRVFRRDEQLAALLHDVVEDCDDQCWTFGRLREEGFPEVVVAALECLTKRVTDQGEEEYFAFIDRCKADPVARAVKRADLLDNLDVTRYTEMNAKTLTKTNKYLKALRILEEAGA